MNARTYHLSNESHEQKMLMQWADSQKQKFPQLLSLFSVPNGGLRVKAVAAQLQAEGLKPGVPDLFLAYPSNGYAGMFLEMKRRVGGRLSDAQKEWRERLSMAGYCVVVAAGWEVAKDAIIEYLTPKP